MHGRSCPELGDQDGHQTKQQPLEPQDYAVEMANELFQVRKLIWEELQQHAKPSEVLELRTAIGNQLIDENEELRKELSVLVEILAEFQQANDAVRDALIRRPRMPEPPGRPLLLEKLKLLVYDLRARAAEERVGSQNQELMAYVLSTADEGDKTTPRMSDSSSGSASAGLAVPLRPGTSSGKRPGTSSSRRPETAGSQRPVSRGSTVSVSSSTILEMPELPTFISFDRIDAITDDLQSALMDEQQQLLEDIEFIQGCLEMEKDLIDDDRRKVSAKPPPSLTELNEFRRALEKTLEDEDAKVSVESIFSKTSSLKTAQATNPVLHPLPLDSRRTYNHADSDEFWSTPPSCGASSRPERTGSTTRVLKIRHVVQKARDEPYLS